MADSPFVGGAKFARSRTGTPERRKSFEDFIQVRNNDHLRAGWRGAVTADHYRVLGVAPGAEDAVIRAAYRALDADVPPGHEPRSAGAVAGSGYHGSICGARGSERRAAYDAGQIFGGGPAGGERAWVDADRRSPPMRAAGLASIAVAIAVTLAFALPRSQPELEPQALRDLAAYRGITDARARRRRYGCGPREESCGKEFRLAPTDDRPASGAHAARHPSDVNQCDNAAQDASNRTA